MAFHRPSFFPSVERAPHCTTTDDPLPPRRRDIHEFTRREKNKYRSRPTVRSVGEGNIHMQRASERADMHGVERIERERA
jgi:hypothetical protein